MFDAGLFREMRWRNDRAASRQPDQGARRRAEPAEHVLHRRRQRRRLEDDRRRPDVEADLRRAADRIDRRDRRRAVRSERRSTSAAAKGCSVRTSRTGDGIYKSTDAGKTWTHLGLRDGQQIPQIVVDPKDPNRLFVAVLGHPYGPNAERGIFRSTDGGTDVREGALQGREHRRHRRRCSIRRTRNIVYAALWEARQGPWENGDVRGPGSGLFKSTDGGTTWRQLGQGLPDVRGAIGLGRIGIAVAPSHADRGCSRPSKRRATAGLYRSDDAGETWTRVDRRSARAVARSPTSPRCASHPTNPDIVIVPSIVDLEIHRRRQDVHGVSRRARRRRLPSHLDQSRTTPTSSLHGVRPGRGHHA